MSKKFKIERFDSFGQIVIKNIKTNEYICRVNFTDYENDESAIKMADLIAKQLNENNI